MKQKAGRPRNPILRSRGLPAHIIYLNLKSQQYRLLDQCPLLAKCLLDDSRAVCLHEACLVGNDRILVAILLYLNKLLVTVEVAVDLELCVILVRRYSSYECSACSFDRVLCQSVFVVIRIRVVLALKVCCELCRKIRCRCVAAGLFCRCCLAAAPSSPPPHPVNATDTIAAAISNATIFFFIIVFPPCYENKSVDLYTRLLPHISV